MLQLDDENGFNKIDDFKIIVNESLFCSKKSNPLTINGTWAVGRISLAFYNLTKKPTSCNAEANHTICNTTITTTFTTTFTAKFTATFTATFPTTLISTSSDVKGYFVSSLGQIYIYPLFQLVLITAAHICILRMYM